MITCSAARSAADDLGSLVLKLSDVKLDPRQSSFEMKSNKACKKSSEALEEIVSISESILKLIKSTQELNSQCR